MPPGPRGHRLIGSLINVRRDRLRFVTRATQQYGDLVVFRMGPKRLYLVSHPDYVKHVLCDNHQNYRKGLGLDEARPLLGDGLLTSEGEQWSCQRRMLQPINHAQACERFSALIVEATLGMVERWKIHARTGQPLDIAQEMVRLTLKILGLTLFRTDFGATMIAFRLTSHF